jgi:hypothetical protein
MGQTKSLSLSRSDLFLPTHCKYRGILLYLITLRGPPHTHTHTHTHNGRSALDEWSARRRDQYLYNTQHSQQTNIHATGGNLTRSPSKQAATDPCPRPPDQWDRRRLCAVEMLWFVQASLDCVPTRHDKDVMENVSTTLKWFTKPSSLGKEATKGKNVIFL